MKHAKHAPASLRTQLIVLVCLVTLLPFSVGQWLSYRHTATVVQENMSDKSAQNVQQMKKTLDATLASYEDLLYQLYTDDTIVALVNQLVSGTDVAMGNNQLRRAIQGKAFVKPYLQAITVLFDDGVWSSYDKLTASATRSSWLDRWDKQALFDSVASTNDTHYFSTAYAMSVMDQPQFLFHIAHRVIDYRRLENRYGIIILSVDEKLLASICNEAWQSGGTADSFHLLTDGNGQVVAAPRQEMIGQTLEADDETGINYARASGLLDSDELTVDSIPVERTGWTLYYFQDQSLLYGELVRQQSLTLWTMLASMVVLVIAIIMLIRLLTRSLGVVTTAMQKAAGGDLSARVVQDIPMPQETAMIARQFNAMMDDINALMEDVKSASKQQRNAEIAMLEAQINPHFLYNTLDTINWMAIDQDAYDVSNAITALAQILRYGIENSNQVVTVRQELDWLKQYLTLQQIRLKNTLEVHINAPEDTQELPVHKLLFQPFVENAILHGFEGVKRTHMLNISIDKEAGLLRVSIHDNGKGMTQAQCDALMSNDGSTDKHHIGVRNAVQRIRMYYGSNAEVSVSSTPGEGTDVTLLLPVTGEARE